MKRINKILQYILFIPVITFMVIGVIGMGFLLLGEYLGRKIGLL